MPPKKTPTKRVTKPSFKRTPEDVSTVIMMAAIGTSQENIARCVGGGIDLKTLRKYFRDEMDTAWIKANTKVGGAMYNKAIGGDVSAQKYWMGCRAGWKETTVTESDMTINVITGVPSGDD
jgi:hypothetical protein